MPDTRITKERVKNHWMYSSWKYLLMIVIFVAGWNLTYSITEYKPPRERRLEMYILSDSYNEDAINILEEELTPGFVPEGEETARANAVKGEKADPDSLEEFNIYTMSYGGEGDTYGPQVLMTRLASLEGDVYMVNEETLAMFVSQELALPLDEYIDSGALDAQDWNLESVTRAETAGEDDDGNVIYTGARHVYAMPAQQLYGMLNESIIDNRGMYFVVMSYTDKPELCVELLNALTERFKIDKPDWLIQQEERQRQEIAELPSELTVDSLKAQATPEPTAEAENAEDSAAQP